MKGIILKDLYQNFGIKKNSMSLLINYIVIMLNFITPGIFSLLFIALFFIPFVTFPMLIINATENDEKSHYNKIQVTMPVTRKEIVKSKYLLGFIFLLFNLLLVLVGVLLHLFLYKSINLEASMNIMTSSTILFLFSFAINYLSCFVLKGFGVIITLVMIIISGVIYYFDLYKTIFNMIPLYKTFLQPLLMIVAILLIYLSYQISFYFYKKSEFN